MEFLDEVNDLESLHHQQGYEAGLKDSKKALGASEGFHFGYHKAFSIGSEIGYYFGVVLYHQGNAVKKPELYSEKVVKLLDKLKILLINCPVKNETTDIEASISEIRSQYKKLCSLMKLKPYSSQDNSLSF